MASINPFVQLLPDINLKPSLIPADTFRGGGQKLDAEAIRLLKRAGVTAQMLESSIQADVAVSYDRFNMYQELHRACFVGSTKVYLLNGTWPTLKEMSDNPDEYIGKYTLSVDPKTQELEPDKIISVGQTRKPSKILRVVLDNGEPIECTWDHEFLLRDGSYREAQDLKYGDSLMPFYIRYHRKGLEGYPAVYNPRTKTYPYMHQHVATKLLGYKKGGSIVVHHKDFNQKNSDPSNLELMESSDHKSFHMKLAHKKRKKYPPLSEECKQNLRGKIPWNKDLTKETDSRVAKYAKSVSKFYQSEKGEERNRKAGEKISKLQTGRTLSQETINKMKVAQDGRYEGLTPEERYGEEIGAQWRKSNKKAQQKRFQNPEQRERGRKNLEKARAKRIENLNKAKTMECLLNHKVKEVVFLDEYQEVYCMKTEKNHNFPLAAGVFVHNSEHWFVGPCLDLYSNTACLTADTKIPLLDGRLLTIGEIVTEFFDNKNMWLYSCDYQGSPVPAKLLGAIKQKNKADTLRVWLDNGEYVEASCNHRFVKRDGSICRADELKIDDSLMPFHRSEMPNSGYERVWDVLKKNWTSTYKMVAGFFYGVDLTKINLGKKLEEHHGDYVVVHHVDFDKINNHPDNLLLMNSGEHLDLHTSVVIERWKDPVWRAMMEDLIKVSHNTPEYLKGASERSSHYWNGPDGEKRRAEQSERLVGRKIKLFGRLRNALAQMGKTLSSQHKINIGKGLLKAVEEGRKENHKITKICPVCGKEFQVCPSYDSIVYCSQKCSGISQTKPRTKKICPVCKITFEVLPCQNDTICCSRKCDGIRRTIPLEKRVCVWCKEIFECTPSSSKKLCSVLCLGRYSNEVQRVRREAAKAPSNNHKVVKIAHWIVCRVMNIYSRRKPK